MKQNLVWLIFCIDRSGSMSSIKNDMIGGFNQFIKQQLEANIGECRVFAYKFDDTYEVMFEDVDLKDVPILDTNNYVPRGMTALYDAMAITIDNVGARLASMKEEDRPEKVLVVTITDGEENSSRKFGQLDVANRVKHQQEVYNWSFAYIGANQDSWAVGHSIGYVKGTTLDYTANTAGVAYAFDALKDSTTVYRCAAGPSTRFKFTPSNPDEDEDEGNKIVKPAKTNSIKGKTTKAPTKKS